MGAREGMTRWVWALPLLGCATATARDPTSKPPSDAGSVSINPAGASEGGLDVGSSPFIPPNANTDAGNPWCQRLPCYGAVTLLPGCVTPCLWLSVQTLIIGPQCEDCANPVDVSACGYFCVEPADY